jgi:2-oxoglutarate ferredoxin oxidoreductase subunit delta
MVNFYKDRCKGCSLCVDACPKKIIRLARDEMNAKGFHPAECIEQSKCISCAFCAIMCPDVVITVTKGEN